MWRWIIVTIVLLAIAAAVAWGVLWAAEPVDVAIVQRGRVDDYIEERAKTALPRTQRITMPFAGALEPVELEPGDRVSAGEVLARLDDGELRAHHRMAEARIAAARARIAVNDDTRIEDLALEELPHIIHSVELAVAAAGEQVTASEARRGFAQRQLERIRAIYEEAATHPRELDEAELRRIEAEVDHRQDELSYRAAEAIETAIATLPGGVELLKANRELRRAVLEQELAEAEADLARIQRDLERSELKSPGDAIVLKRHSDGGEDLPAGAVVLELGRPELMHLIAEVLTTQAGAIGPGDPVELRGLVDDRPIAGRVEAIRPRARTVISSLGVEEQRVEVVIAFDERQEQGLAAWQEEAGAIGVGYRAWARIITGRAEGALHIPRTALYRGDDGRWRVLALRDGRAMEVVVEVGLGNDQQVEVRDGLEEGEQVVISPDERLRPGQRLRPRR